MKLNRLYIACLAVAAALAVSCQQKELPAPATVSDLKAYPGYLKAMVEFTAPAEAVSGKVFFNSGEFQTFEIDTEAELQRVIVEGLKEGENTLRVALFNAAGVISDPKAVDVKVYGDSYKADVVPRQFIEQKSTGTTSIELYFGDSASGETEVRLTYTTTGGEEKTVVLPASESIIAIDDIDVGKPYTFVSVYKPEEECIDEFISDVFDVRDALKKIMDKTIWSAEGAADSAHDASKLIDNDVNTYWRASSAQLAAGVVVDMKMEKIFSQIVINQARETAGGCFAKRMTVEVSLDGENWTPAIEKGLKASAYRQVFDLPSQLEARYVRLSITQSSDSNLPVQLAELDLNNELTCSGQNGEDIPTLRNATVPFAGDGSDRFPSVGAGRMQRVADWSHNDNAYISMDTAAGNKMCIWSCSVWGCSDVSNGKVWQTLKLLPGEYSFVVTSGNTTTPEAVEAYAAVNGESLPDITGLQEGTASAIASVRIPSRSDAITTLDFTLNEEMSVNVGYVYNSYGMYATHGYIWSELYFNKFEVVAR